MDTYLDTPAQITIIRDKNIIDAAMSVEYMCNGEVIGKLKNGQSITITTQKAERILSNAQFRRRRSCIGQVYPRWAC